ncbi:MAG: hypothetical protein JO138_18765 [Acidobacteriaceae bacterium]|nr:hypothetical protein [Acidobacteriaceae bacterium]
MPSKHKWGGACRPPEGFKRRTAARRLEALEVIGRFLRVCRCAEDGPLVVLQHVQPMPDISGVVVADFRRDGKVSA